MSDATPVIWITLLMPAAIFFALPRLRPRGYFFGIPVPPEFPRTELGRGTLRGYMIAVAVAFAVGVATGIAVPQAAAVAVLLPIFGSVGAFFYARHHVKLSSSPGNRLSEAEIGREPLPAWTILGLLPFAVPVAVGLYLRSRWDEIPIRFPVHWDWNGQPNRWVERTARGVFAPLWFSAGMMALMALLALVMFYGSRPSPLRIAVVKIMIGVEYLLAIIFAIVGLLPLHRFSAAALFLPIFAFVAAFLAYLFKLAAEPGIPAEATPDECWHLSTIYYNPADPALFVQQRIGLGYTLNLGNPASWVILGVSLAVIPLAVLLMR